VKAVMPQVPEEILRWRSRTGADRWDEMWEGVLHMAPAPTRQHQRLAVQIHAWLETYWARPRGGEVDLSINVASVGGWPHDYRIPDLVLLTPDRFPIDRDDYLEGAPAVVVEIRSPGDETLEKLPFYAKLGVPEVWSIDRDSRAPQILRLSGNDYEEVPPDVEGWLQSPVTDVRLRAEPGNKLAIQIHDAPASRRLLPEGR